MNQKFPDEIMLKAFVFFLLTNGPLAFAQNYFRPDGGVEIDSVCICKGKISLNSPECKSFCLTKPQMDHVATLYAHMVEKNSVSMNLFYADGGKTFGTFKNWCQKEIDDRMPGPHCEVEIKQSYESRYESSYFPKLQDHGFSVQFAPESGQVYTVRITERTSNASSNPYQVKVP